MRMTFEYTAAKALASLELEIAVVIERGQCLTGNPAMVRRRIDWLSDGRRSCNLNHGKDNQYCMN